MKKIILSLISLMMIAPGLSAQDIDSTYNAYLDTVPVFEMELDSIVFVAARKSGKKISRRNKKALIARFKEQVKLDFPKEIREYNVSSNYVVKQENKVMTSGTVNGLFVESPYGSSKRRDTLMVRNDKYSEYINPMLKENLKAAIDQDSVLLERVHIEDPSEMKDRHRQIHGLLWGTNPSSMLDLLEKLDGKWDYIHNGDGTSYVIFRGKMGLLGFYRVEWKVNFLVETRTLSIREFTQEVSGNFNIPFGYKLKEEHLAYLNAANIAYSPFKKFRVRKGDLSLKRNVSFAMNDSAAICPLSKIVDMKTSIHGRRNAVINISAKAEATVL